MPQDPEEMTPETGIGQVAKARTAQPTEPGWEEFLPTLKHEWASGKGEMASAPFKGYEPSAFTLGGAQGQALLSGLLRALWSPAEAGLRKGAATIAQSGQGPLPIAGGTAAYILPQLLSGLLGKGRAPVPSPKTPPPTLAGAPTAPTVSELTRPWVGIYKGAPAEGRTVPKSYKAPKTYDLTEDFIQK